eukprot:1149344-Pelagomonas_calceolata.AAC.1
MGTRLPRGNGLSLEHSLPTLLELYPRDVLFVAHHKFPLAQIVENSICHPIYDDKAMTLALWHAIYSAILNTEATATFMFLPASGKLMISNPYSKLLTAYPHLCFKLGTTPESKLPYDNP